MKTMASEVTKDSRFVSLKIKSQDPSFSDTVHIHRSWTIDGDTFKCPSQRLCDSWQHCKYLGIPEYNDPSEVKRLIGIDHPEVHLQLEIRRGEEHQPLAVRTKLGWTVMGVELRSEEESDSLEASTRCRAAGLTQEILGHWVLWGVSQFEATHILGRQAGLGDFGQWDHVG